LDTGEIFEINWFVHNNSAFFAKCLLFNSQ
jgi:hypothetical protein